MIEKKVIWLILFVFFGLSHSSSGYGDSECRDRNSGMLTMHLEEISLLNGKGKILKIDSFIADSSAERASGYQFICRNVIDRSTILFVYQQSVMAQFHMRNVTSPLDIGFFDDQGILIKSLQMDTYADGNSRLYHPGQAFQFALEARPGYFHSNDLFDGTARLLIGTIYDGK